LNGQTEGYIFQTAKTHLIKPDGHHFTMGNHVCSLIMTLEVLNQVCAFEIDILLLQIGNHICKFACSHCILPLVKFNGQSPTLCISNGEKKLLNEPNTHHFTLGHGLETIHVGVVLIHCHHIF
jgi:hypothetical protein